MYMYMQIQLICISYTAAMQFSFCIRHRKKTCKILESPQIVKTVKKFLKILENPEIFENLQGPVVQKLVSANTGLNF